MCFVNVVLISITEYTPSIGRISFCRSINVQRRAIDPIVDYNIAMTTQLASMVYDFTLRDTESRRQEMSEEFAHGPLCAKSTFKVILNSLALCRLFCEQSI